MCRVNPSKIRQPEVNEKFWILNPTPDEIRPYRILIKKYFTSPLSDNSLKIIKSPADYIVQAIRSNNHSFYQENNAQGKFSLYKDDNDHIFMFRFYSSNNYRPLNEYMYKEEIVQQFQNGHLNKYKGFTREQFDSIICCLQYALLNCDNRKLFSPNLTVYRGITNNKFPEYIGIGSQFYFPNFISASIDINVAKSFIHGPIGTLMKIKIENNGTDERHPNYCVYIEDYSTVKGEKETLICSHCFFQVTNIVRNHNGIDYVDLICRGYLLNN